MSKPNSRFSTLKVFKFGSKSSGGGGPPPPPKDEYYNYQNGQSYNQQLGGGAAGSNNNGLGSAGPNSPYNYTGGQYGYAASASGSYASLSQSLNVAPSPTSEAQGYYTPAGSVPQTPIDPRAPSPAPSRTTLSSVGGSTYAPSSSAHGSTHTSNSLNSINSHNSSVSGSGSGNGSGNMTPDTARSGRGFKLPSFGRKMSRGPASPDASTPPPPVQSFPTAPPPPDEGISMPWNFQHNMHVDESMNGMPPNWIESLTQAGFTEDDLQAIKAGRNRSPMASAMPIPAASGGSSQGNQGGPGLLGGSPQLTAQGPGQPPILARPQPRSSSLFRAPSQVSFTSQAASRRPGVQERKGSDASSTYSVAMSSSANNAPSAYPARSGSSLSHRSDLQQEDERARRSGDHTRDEDESWEFTTPQRTRQGSVSKSQPTQQQEGTPSSPPPIYRLDDSKAGLGSNGDEKGRYQAANAATARAEAEVRRRRELEDQEQEDSFDHDYYYNEDHNDEDGEDDDGRRNTMVPNRRRDTVSTLKTSNRDTLVPRDRDRDRDTLVPGSSSNRDTMRPAPTLVPATALSRSPSVSTMSGSLAITAPSAWSRDRRPSAASTTAPTPADSAPQSYSHSSQSFTSSPNGSGSGSASGSGFVSAEASPFSSPSSASTSAFVIPLSASALPSPMIDMPPRTPSPATSASSSRFPSPSASASGSTQATPSATRQLPANQQSQPPTLHLHPSMHANSHSPSASPTLSCSSSRSRSPSPSPSPSPAASRAPQEYPGSLAGASSICASPLASPQPYTTSPSARRGPAADPPSAPPSPGAPQLPPLTNPKRRSKRFSALPPRLSLDQGTIGDLASWSASLFSNLSAAGPDADALGKQQASVPLPPPAAVANSSTSFRSTKAPMLTLSFTSSPSVNTSASTKLPTITESSSSRGLGGLNAPSTLNSLSIAPLSAGSAASSPGPSRPITPATRSVTPQTQAHAVLQPLQPQKQIGVQILVPNQTPVLPLLQAGIRVKQAPDTKVQTEPPMLAQTQQPIPDLQPQTAARSQVSIPVQNQGQTITVQARLQALSNRASGLPANPRLQHILPARTVPSAAADRAAAAVAASLRAPGINGLPASPRPPGGAPVPVEAASVAVPAVVGLPPRPTPKASQSQLRVQTIGGSEGAPEVAPVTEPVAIKPVPVRSESIHGQAVPKVAVTKDTPNTNLGRPALSVTAPGPTSKAINEPYSPLQPPTPLIIKPKKRKPAPLTELGSRPTSPSSPLSDESSASGNISAALPTVTTPLWNDLLGMSSPGASSVSSGSDPKSGPSSAMTNNRISMGPALEANSPILPTRTPLELRAPKRVSQLVPPRPVMPHIPPPLSLDQPRLAEPVREELEDFEFLSPQSSPRKRDSDMTVRSDRDSGVNVSAEIVRGAVVTYQRAVPVSVRTNVRVLEPPKEEDERSPVQRSGSVRGRVAAAVQAIDRLAPPPSPSQSQFSSPVTTPTNNEPGRPPSPTASVSSSSRSASPSAGWSSSSSHRPAFTIITSVSSVEGQPSPKSPNGLAYLDGGSHEASPHPSPKGTQTVLSPASQPSPHQPSPFPSSWRAEFGQDKFNPVPVYDQEEYEANAAAGQRMLLDEVGEEEQESPISTQNTRAPRPRIVVSGIGLPAVGQSEVPSSSSSSVPNSAISPAQQRYRGWVYEVLAPLGASIDESVDPHQRYTDLQEIGEGESGSVFSARVSSEAAVSSKRRREDKSPSALAAIVAVKIIPIDPSGSPKIEQLKKELDLMQDVRNLHVLTMDMLFIDAADDALWIRMELMERSLADVIALADEGVEVSEVVMARFAADALSAVEYLTPMGIAHRDVRSDNMLITGAGVLKLVDFSSAVRVQPGDPPCAEVAGVPYWQAPEVRSGSYDPLKVDIYSVGATVWEMAQHEPPFSDVQDFRHVGHQWPELDNADDFSRPFHDFLRLCSMPAASRPDAGDLLHTPFIRSAVPRADIVNLLATCRALEGGETG